MRAPGPSALAGSEGVVEEVAGPNDDGSGWSVTVRIGPEGSRLVTVRESELRSTGMALDDRGRRVPTRERPAPDELSDRIELRLFTEIADGIAAARAAAAVEVELEALAPGASISTVAERHWSEPYNYEFTLTLEPAGEPVEALQRLAHLGDGHWIACRDDGWQVDLWWSADGTEGGVFLTPEIHGAELCYRPWGSPRRRPESARPLISVRVRAGLSEPGGGPSDAEAGDEEA